MKICDGTGHRRIGEKGIISQIKGGCLFLSIILTKETSLGYEIVQKLLKLTRLCWVTIGEDDSGVCSPMERKVTIRIYVQL